MQIERNFDKQVALWHEALADTERKLEGFRETALLNAEHFHKQHVERVYGTCDAPHGSRETYYYFFRVGNDEAALTISDKNDNTLYIEGYNEARQHAEYLSGIWNETVYIVEDLSEVIVHVVQQVYTLAFDCGNEWEGLLSTLYAKQYEREPEFLTLEAAIEKGKAASEDTPAIVAVLGGEYHAPVAFCYNGEVFRPSTTSGQQ